MRHGNDPLKSINPDNVIPVIENLISQENLIVEANAALNNRIDYMLGKERVADLKLLLSWLRTELRS